MFLQQLLNGLAIGGVYAIFALGYTLVFSILGIINFAHGAIFALGAYFTYTLTGAQFGFNGLLAQSKLPFGLPFILATLGGALLAGLFGVIIERLAFRPLRVRNADPLLTLVSSLGVAVAIVNLIQYLVGAEIYTFQSNVLAGLPPAINFGTPEQPVPVRTVQIVIFIVSIIIVILLTYMMNGTKLAGD
jgi:branched-chain amino acid transport system permease protein